MWCYRHAAELKSLIWKRLLSDPKFSSPKGSQGSLEMQRILAETLHGFSGTETEGPAKQRAARKSGQSIELSMSRKKHI